MADTKEVQGQANGSPAHREPSANDSPTDVFMSEWKQCIQELECLEKRAMDVFPPIYNLGPILKSHRNSIDRLVKRQAQDFVSEGLTPEESREVALTRVMNLDTTTWRLTWPLVKKYRGLLHINKKYLRGPRYPVEAPLDWQSLLKQRPREEPVVFDAILENGMTWLKVLHTGHAPLLKQIARASWEMGCVESDNEDGDEDAGEASALDATDFYHSIRRYVQSARWNHCRKLHFLLVNIEEGKAPEIDALLGMVRSLSDASLEIEVRCSNHPFLTIPPPPVESAINNLLFRSCETTMEDEYRTITPGAANLDPSVLFSMVSDLLHGPVPQQPEGQRIIIAKARELQQDGTDRKGKPWEETLHSVLYPALRGRRLVCTRAAARYFWKVVDAIATDSEETRGSLILPRDEDPPRTPAELRTEFQRWSNVELPPDMQLPIEVADDVGLPEVASLVGNGQLPPMAAGVARDISPLNRSIYFYGWAHRITTVSSHRGVPRQIDLAVAQHWTPEDSHGPDIWTKNLQGYLVHREKPATWREMLPDGVVPPEVRRWANDWATWGRGISSYGLPDSKTWEGVGHPEIQRFGRGEKRRDPEGAEKAPEDRSTVILPWDEDMG